MIENLLLTGFGPQVLAELAELVRPGLSGRLNDAPLQKCSIRGAGRRAFVIKGWADIERGPALRFRARWGRLADGEVLIQATPVEPWRPAFVTAVDLAVTGGGLALTVEFEDAAGAEHAAVFETC